MKRFKLIVLVLVFGFSHSLFGQNWVSDDNNFETNWNFTFQLGQTALLSEINSNFVGTSNDMNNQPDWGYSLQIAKMFWERFDVGLEVGVSNFKGFKNYSNNVNWLNLHTQFNNDEYNFEPYAIYYDSDFTNFTLFTKYNLVNFSNFSQGYFKMNLYFKLGIGLIFPSVEMGYKDLANYEFTGLTHPLYLKGRYPEPEKDSHFIFHPAAGVNYQLSDRVFVSLETSLQFLGADNLDGIHNFNALLRPSVPDKQTPEYRIHVFTMTAKFMVGATYFFNFDSQRQSRQKNLPWYNHVYKSYYSKYQRPSTKEARQEYLPFFKEDLSDE